MPHFEYQDKQIFYSFDGDKNNPVLVILNGIMMSTLSWDPFIEDLAKEYYILRLDMLDQGQSSKMSSNYTQKIQVDMIKALLDYLDLTKVHMLGISYGGSIALQFAANYLEYLDKLLLFNIVAYTSPWLKAIGDGWNAVAESRNGEAFYHITIPFIYSPQFYTQRLDWMEARKKILVPIFSNAAFLDAMIRLTKSAETHDVREQLSAIHCETLVVTGTEDYLTPPFEQKYLVDRLPNATHITFEGCGHASMYEQPKLFVGTVIGFLKADKTLMCL